jgi:hypothetical protein
VLDTKSPKHLEMAQGHISLSDIDVVGNKELSCAGNQDLQHGGKPKDGNIYAFKCKYLKISFLMCLV